jgi:hypothetical protein
MSRAIFRVVFEDFVLFAQLSLAAGQFGVGLALALLGLLAHGHVAHQAQEQQAAFLHLDEGIGKFDIDGLAGAEGDMAFQQGFDLSFRKALLIFLHHVGHILGRGINDGVRAPDQFLRRQADDLAKGRIDRQHDPLLVGQPHAFEGFLPDGTEAHSEKRNFSSASLRAVMSSTMPS